MFDKNDFDAGTAEQRRSMKYAILAAVGGTMGEFCLGGGGFFGGQIIALLALKFGAGNLFLGILGFSLIIPSICGIFTMSAIERVGKKKVLLYWATAAAIFIFPFMFLPLLNGYWSASACLALILAATFLRNACNALSGSGWMTLLHDIVPPKITGRFFAKLNLSWQSSGLIVMLGSAWLFRNNSEWWRFETIFAVALAAYIFRTVTIIPIVEKPFKPHDAKGSVIFARFSEAMREKPVVLLIAYVTVYMTASLISEPFKIKMLNDFGCSYGFILAATSMISLGAILSLLFWGKLADKFGNRAIFTLSNAAGLILSLLWILVSENNVHGVFIFGLYFLWSVFNNGNMLAQSRYIMHLVPPDKQNYINIINIITRLSMAFAPLLGGLFLYVIERLNLVAHQNGHVTGYRILFLISAFIFLCASGFVKKCL